MSRSGSAGQFVVMLASLAAACDGSGRDRPAVADGGRNDAGDGPSFADTSEVTDAGRPRRPLCPPGDLYCDGFNVRQCLPEGKPGGPVVDTCVGGLTCSFGRCTTPSCAASESKRSLEGCLFYPIDLDNTEYDDKGIFGIPVGNPGVEPADVVLERRTDTGWESVLAATVPPGLVSYLRLAKGPGLGIDYHVEGTGQEMKAYRLTAKRPIVAYQINADDENASAGSSGSTILLPAHGLGYEHFAIAPPERGVTMGGIGGSFGGDHGFVSIVGTRSGTRLKVTVGGPTRAGGPIPAMAAGGSYETTLDEGEVVNIETSEAGSDLSGSLVESDRPVAVFAGNVCGGFDPTRTNDCDHVEEQMFPVETWGRNFVVLDMRMPMHGASSEVWAIVVASEDGTELAFDAPMPGGWAGLPTGTVSLGRGESRRITIAKPLSGFWGSPYAHYAVKSNKPVGIASFMGTEEGGAWVVPVDQFLDEYLISAHPWFTAYLMVTRPASTPVTFDGVVMTDAQFQKAGGGFEVSFVAIPRCEADPTKCGHRVLGSKVGVTLTANGGVCNYCYAGGAGARCLDKMAGCP